MKMNRGQRSDLLLHAKGKPVYKKPAAKDDVAGEGSELTEANVDKQSEELKKQNDELNGCLNSASTKLSNKIMAVSKVVYDIKKNMSALSNTMISMAEIGITQLESVKNKLETCKMNTTTSQIEHLDIEHTDSKVEVLQNAAAAINEAEEILTGVKHISKAIIAKTGKAASVASSRGQ